MDVVNDKPGFRTEGNDSDSRASEDEVELLDELHDSETDEEAHELENLLLSPSEPRSMIPKPPSRRPVIAPAKPPVIAPSKPPVRPPPRPPVKPPINPPTTAPSPGGTTTLSAAKQSVLVNFIAPVIVAYTVDQLTGQRSVIHPQGSQQNADGSVTHPNGSVALTDGSVKHPDGGMTKPDGLYVAANGDTFDERTGVYTFADGVRVQAVKNSSGQWEFPDVKAPEAGKDDAPPESSATELYTYENGDTFDHNSGVFTYFEGASVQYVKNSGGEWEAPDSK